MEATSYKKVKEAKGLQVGEVAPNFSAVDLHDNVFNLGEALKNGPVVVIFYRGQWCPFCNKHLKTLEQSLDKIYEKGASVVAVSPEKSEFLKRTADKTKASFSLLFDEDYKISEAFNVVFRPTKLERTIYNKILKADLTNAHSDESQQLPIPATFIIGKDGKIAWRHFDPDYKKRSTVDDIVKNIPN
ncbi:MAG: AhpC/TSA family protein [Prolixibacteraceae bacterium]|nr:AhpC/TSA family protein [Prolixibacteraceae bacterium]